MKDNIERASSLCAWLIREKQVKRNVAVLISCNKHKVSFSLRSQVSKNATKLIKEWDGKQETLL